MISMALFIREKVAYNHRFGWHKSFSVTPPVQITDKSEVHIT